MTQASLDRREFARLFAFGGSAALLSHPAFAGWPPPLAALETGGAGVAWDAVRAQFLMPPGVAVFNAANLCPSAAPVLKSVYDHTRELDSTPSMKVRNAMLGVKETTRRLLAEMLRVTPEEIIITRNTSESNNLVSNGLDLAAGDEVLIFSDNHPSNHQAWREKARRHGYTVRVIDQVNLHPGADYYVDAFRRAMTARTKVIAFSHVTNTVGDVMPAKELCALARERGVLSLVDGAQSFGLLDVDLADMAPDFYSGSAHKWLCGPKETGVLFANARSQPKLWPTIYSAYVGETGFSKTFEGMGQRDEPAIQAFGDAITFQGRIGRRAIQARSWELGRALVAGLRKIDGVKVWSHGDPQLSAPVVSFRPGSLDAGRLADVLFEKDGIICAVRGGSDRGGLRFSPHFYNSHAEVERALAAVGRAMKAGV